MGERYYVATTTGYLTTGHPGGGRFVGRTFMVLDRLRCHNAVSLIRSEDFRGHAHHHAMRLAEDATRARCAELNDQAAA